MSPAIMQKTFIRQEFGKKKKGNEKEEAGKTSLAQRKQKKVSTGEKVLYSGEADLTLSEGEKKDHLHRPLYGKGKTFFLRKKQEGPVLQGKKNKRTHPKPAAYPTLRQKKKTFCRPEDGEREEGENGPSGRRKKTGRRAGEGRKPF